MSCFKRRCFLVFIYAFILHQIRKFVNKKEKIIYKIKFQHKELKKIKKMLKKTKLIPETDYFMLSN